MASLPATRRLVYGLVAADSSCAFAPGCLTQLQIRTDGTRLAIADCVYRISKPSVCLRFLTACLILHRRRLKGKATVSADNYTIISLTGLISDMSQATYLPRPP